MTFIIKNNIKEQVGEKFLFNFRKGNVEQNYSELTKKGINFEQVPKTFEDRVSIDAKLRDLNGNLKYFDTHPSEKQIRL